MGELSLELQELVVEAIDLALDCFSAGEQNPFILLADESGKARLVDVKDAEDDVTPELVQGARDLVARSLGQGSLRYAIAYDGYLTNEEGRTDAVFVEAGTRGEPEGLLIAQQYRVKKRSRKPERIGSPTIVGAAEQLLS